MRLCFLVCLVFLVFVVLVGAETSPKATKKLQSSFSIRTIDIGSTATRLLRSNNDPDKGHSEERTGGSALEKLTNAFKPKGVPEKLEKWLKDEKAADTVFKRLNLHVNKRGQSLFDKPYFAAWVEYADALNAKMPEMSAISILTKRYGGDSLVNMIKAANMNPSTQSIASKLEMKQIQHWLTIKKDPAELFRLFKLDTDVKNIFETPEFTTWVKYVDDLSAKY
ncbi:RxLR effector protein [Phytophthora megakarya]|uniref:RxLR effector protein n=1 Tax=Phytophthora megakarya TaxID=4795 RepID=A0A225VZZ6_9STRA|nr:RxLR effector protein [Phytophthora megakarya]